MSTCFEEDRHRQSIESVAKANWERDLHEAKAKLDFQEMIARTLSEQVLSEQVLSEHDIQRSEKVAGCLVFAQSRVTSARTLYQAFLDGFDLYLVAETDRRESRSGEDKWRSTFA